MTKAQPPSSETGRRGFDFVSALPVAIMALTTLIMVAAMVFGAEILGVEGKEGVARLLEGFQSSPIAAIVVIAVFTLLGLTGFPQFLLIGGTVAIFGPLWGFVYSWIATMVSALVGFFIGRLSGGSVLRRFGGEKIMKASEMLGRRGIMASFIVRLVPSGPFVVVNMVAGISHITLAQFVIGSGLGIVPKTAVIAFLGGRLLEFIQHQNPVELAIIGAVLVAWLAAGFWLRRRFMAKVSAETSVPAVVDAVPVAQKAQGADKL